MKTLRTLIALASLNVLIANAAMSSASSSSLASTESPTEPPAIMLTAEMFSACLKNFAEKAAAAGVSKITIDGSLAHAHLNSRVLELDRQQPEFTTTFAHYFNRSVSDQRVAQGRELWVKHRVLLDKVAQQYGVPAVYLLAFWGLETNFGSYFGNIPVVDSLATLGCDARRSEFFTRELIFALRILDEGAITSDKMVGSWAGAMGHVQFMPSAFLQYAVDYDGDGKRNLWGSTADAMASGANFLQHLGWQPGERWGREVKLPKGFSFIEAGLKNKKPLSQWKKLGVRNADNSLLPQADMNASLLVPSGYQGPAFLVYENFNVIMRWNRSEFYALAVGHLADRIAGAGTLLQTPPTDAPRLHRAQVIAVQTQLQQRGFYAAKIDGVFGSGTRNALSAFQHEQGMVADGFAGHKVLELLGVVTDAVAQ